MSTNVGADQLALISIEGMHCHKCEMSIQKALSRLPGVHEVEVDFNSGQASVLFQRDSISISQLLDVVNNAGYRTLGFSQRQTDHVNT